MKLKKNSLSTGVLALTIVVLFSAAIRFEKSGDVTSAPAKFKVDTVVTGLKSPWSVAFLPTGEMLVTERTEGKLRMVKNGVIDPTPIGGLPEMVTKGQGGLLEVVLHPKYRENGWIYLSFASPKKDGEDGEGANTEFIRARLKGHELVDVQKVFKAYPNVKGNNHFGGRIVFDGKGYVYLSVGERGQKEKSQDLSVDQGRILRLHEDGKIPADNPFVKQAGARPEIYAWGIRNPQGLVFQPGTGVLWEHEHGPQGGDELNIIEKGKNYGWPAITYGIDYDNSIITKDTVKAGMEQPVLFWRPSIAPCGMAFIASDKYPGLKGDLLVGSLKFMQLRHLKVKGKKVIEQNTILQGIGRVRDIKQAPDGFIYVVLETSGKVVKLLPAS